MVSFVDLFRLLGIIFLLLVPLVLLMRRPRTGRAGRGALGGRSGAHAQARAKGSGLWAEGGSGSAGLSV